MSKIIKEYLIVEYWEVPEYSQKGYVPIGGVCFYDGVGVQGMALYYSDDVTRVES